MTDRASIPRPGWPCSPNAEFGAFQGMNLPSDDLAAVSVHDHAQVKEHATDGRGQPGDIPAPHLIGGDGEISPRRGGCYRFPATDPVVLLVCFMQNPAGNDFHNISASLRFLLPTRKPAIFLEPRSIANHIHCLFVFFCTKDHISSHAIVRRPLCFIILNIYGIYHIFFVDVIMQPRL